MGWFFNILTVIYLCIQPRSPTILQGRYFTLNQIYFNTVSCFCQQKQFWFSRHCDCFLISQAESVLAESPVNNIFPSWQRKFYETYCFITIKESTLILWLFLFRIWQTAAAKGQEGWPIWPSFLFFTPYSNLVHLYDWSSALLTVPALFRFGIRQQHARCITLLWTAPQACPDRSGWKSRRRLLFQGSHRIH